MIQDVPSEKMAQRVNARVLDEIRATNAILKERHRNNAFSQPILETKAIIRLAWERGMSVDDARKEYSLLRVVEKKKRMEVEIARAKKYNE